jgi:hypothetical protein
VGQNVDEKTAEVSDLYLGFFAGHLDGFARIDEWVFSVIPAKAGIQSFQLVLDPLDSGFHRSDDLFSSSLPSFPFNQGEILLA